jgi:hypothetical protein
VFAAIFFAENEVLIHYKLMAGWFDGQMAVLPIFAVT